MVEIIKKESDKNQDAIQTINVDYLVEGNKIFESKGVSYLKVTQGNVIKRLAIPIKSSGISEMIDEFERTKKPEPPKKRELAQPDSDWGRELKLTRKEWLWIYDVADEQYVKDLTDYQNNLGIKVVLMGMDIVIKDKDGNEIQEDERKIQAMKNMGLTGEHLNQLIKDIRALTQWQEEKESDFLAS